MALGEMVCEDVDSIHLAQDKEFPDKLSSYWLSRTLLHGAGSNYK
jgi:hypothetical protein